MDCKEFEKLVPDFIHKKLDFVTTKRFAEHLHTCPNCKEELNIQFLIDEGLIRLEEGSAFDLQTEMRELLKDADKKVRFHESFLRTGRIVEFFVFLGIAIVVALIIWL